MSASTRSQTAGRPGRSGAGAGSSSVGRIAAGGSSSTGCPLHMPRSSTLSQGGSTS